MSIKKILFFLCVFIYIATLYSCDLFNKDNEQNNEIQTVLVTFFNDSSYNVLVRRDSFYGPIIAEVNTSNRTANEYVRVSDDSGFGTVFSIEYVRYPFQDDLHNENRNISASFYDPAIQLNTILKENQPVTITIPQPANLVCRSAFVKIFNITSLPIDFRYANSFIRQAGNNDVSIAPFQYGIYKFPRQGQFNIPETGEDCQFYNIRTTSEVINFSDFITQNGTLITKNNSVFIFEFKDSEIKKTGEQPITFN